MEEAARHICEEARILLSSLRSGPPAVAHGILAQELQSVRRLVRARFLEDYYYDADSSGITSIAEQEEGEGEERNELTSATPKKEENSNITEDTVTSQECHSSSPEQSNVIGEGNLKVEDESVGPYAHPFLMVIMDPRASGPHTLVALHCLYRLLKEKSLIPSTKNTVATNAGITSTGSGSDLSFTSTGSNSCATSNNFTRSSRRSKLLSPISTRASSQPQQDKLFLVSLEPLLRAILQCKFEQTDIGADEAVEMSMADLVSLIVSLDDAERLHATTWRKAFNTVFITRNTFIHSPALCYHLDDVLQILCTKAMKRKTANKNQHAGKMLLEFLIQQLLYTPSVTTFGDINPDVQLAHDAINVLSLRLVRSCLSQIKNRIPIMEIVLKNIQEDLCLSLLMLGQAFWVDGTDGIYQGVGAKGSMLTTGNITFGSPGISLKVLSEVCATLSLLWNTPSLRTHLAPQMEAIFCGFFQRALVLLQRRPIPNDSTTFHLNQEFDKALEIILETLVDIFCLNQGVLETLFLMFDCQRMRMDVVSALIGEMAQCCGTGEGREVPAHLKIMCANALLGGLRGLFPNDSFVSDKIPSPPPPLLENANQSNRLAKDSPRDIKQTKFILKNGAQLFNKKSSQGIQYLCRHNVLPTPITPLSLAKFLRQGLVAGLDKVAVGMYLGNIGKAPIAGQNPLTYDRDYFHRETLINYCSLFKFQNQGILDGLRMFLSCFRLPGEAQQIDRILQAFAEINSKQCLEAQKGYFSKDEKKAADTAYILAFSIIMLNTDLHNDNIRPEKKMSCDAFIKNNTDYGSDITEEGKEFSSEYLTSIYESIYKEQIRTEGEGADGVMTVERWKDVLRTEDDKDTKNCVTQSNNFSLELKQLVLESIWQPLVCAISGFWNFPFLCPLSGIFLSSKDRTTRTTQQPLPYSRGGDKMLSAQRTRLGMDLSITMLTGMDVLDQKQMLQVFLSYMAFCSGLLPPYTSTPDQRLATFVRSIERQSAVIVTMQVAKEMGGLLGLLGWKCIWCILFELRDLKLLSSNQSSTLLSESCEDLLLSSARKDWNMNLVKGGNFGSMNPNGDGTGQHRKGSFFGAMGRMIFGSEDDDASYSNNTARSLNLSNDALPQAQNTVHEKELLVLWDDHAPSDDEEEDSTIGDMENNSLSLDDLFSDYGSPLPLTQSASAQFESHLIHEDHWVYHDTNTVSSSSNNTATTERVSDREYKVPLSSAAFCSERARTRMRLSHICDFSLLISNSRYLSDDGLCYVLQALLEVIQMSNRQLFLSPTTSQEQPNNRDSAAETASSKRDESSEDTTLPNMERTLSSHLHQVPLSPASEALAEVLITEISLKNRDRFALLWDKLLQKHYYERLGTCCGLGICGNKAYCSDKTDYTTIDPSVSGTKSTINPGIEKCATGLIRLCISVIHREELANRVLPALKLLYPPDCKRLFVYLKMNKQLSEGLWRICCNVDSLQHIESSGWDALLGLLEWCAMRGCDNVIRTNSGRVGLAKDDPAFHAFQSLHLILHAPELKHHVPFGVVSGIRALIKGGERGRYSKLSTAGLDLLLVLHNRLEELILRPNSGVASPTAASSLQEKKSRWMNCWLSILDGMAESGESSSFASVRQHALSMLTDAMIDKHGEAISSIHLCTLINDMCIPLAEKRITNLLKSQLLNDFNNTEEIMIELEVCISLIFKPFLHHLKVFLKETDDKLITMWKSLLKAMALLLGGTLKASASHLQLTNVNAKDSLEHSNTTMTSMNELLLTTKELASEHLRNAVMVLVASNVLQSPSDITKDEVDLDNNITAYTWKCIENMKFCKNHVKEWEQSAAMMKTGEVNVKSSILSIDEPELIERDVRQNVRSAISCDTASSYDE